MFKVYSDKEVMGRGHVVRSDTQVVIGGYIHRLSPVNGLRAFEQPAHFFKKDAVELADKLNSNADYRSMLTF